MLFMNIILKRPCEQILPETVESLDIGHRWQQYNECTYNDNLARFKHRFEIKCCHPYSFGPGGLQSYDLSQSCTRAIYPQKR